MARSKELVRSLTWSGLRPGDPVEIDQPRERRSTFVFVAHVRNESSGDEWVEVRGGRSGEQKDRSFRPELVYPAGSRRGNVMHRPSLIDAPQLPL